MVIAAIGGIDTLVVFIYGAVVLGMGIWLSRKQTSTEEYFVGGRKMHWLIVGISIQATLMSTISYLSVPGEQINNGFGYLGSWLGILPAILVVNLLLMPYFMRIRMTTIYEMLERRFDISVRMFGVAVFLLLRVIWMGLVVFTASFALETITGWPFYVIIIAVGLVGTVYTWVGGMRAVIWTDVVQWVILFGGGIFCILYVMYTTSTGPADWWQAAAQVPHKSQPLFSLDPRVRITIFGMIVTQFFSKICVHGSDQVAVQRYLSTPNSRSAGGAFLSYVGCGLAVTAMMAVLGLALTSVSHYAANGANWAGPADADRIFPWFIANNLPAGIRGLVIAGLLAAAMSSIDSGVNSISAVVTIDIYNRFFAKTRTQLSLSVAKLTTLLAGAVAVGMAFLMTLIPGNLFEVMNRSTGGLPGTLGMIVFAAILLPRCGTKVVLIGAGVSMVCGWLITYSAQIFGPDYGISFMWITPVACVSGLLVAWVLSSVFPTVLESSDSK